MKEVNKHEQIDHTRFEKLKSHKKEVQLYTQYDDLEWYRD